MDVLIRQETAADVDQVFQVVQEAFLNAEYTDHDEHYLVERLRASKAFIPELSLVAEVSGDIVGHILFTRIKIRSEQTEVESLALAPVSVIPGMQGKRVGGRLIEEGHRLAKQQGFRSVIVLGHAAYYPRFGYIPASRFGILPPFDVPDEAFMALELVEHGLAGVDGVVEYAEEFFV